jgi:hypothetical protein
VVALAAALALAAPDARPARAQMPLPTPESYLRVLWTGETRDGRQLVSGYVYNDRDVWATGVQLLVESLDASGRVVGTTTVAVLGSVPPRNRAYFEGRAPAGGSSYRVTVRGVDWKGYGAGGG